MGFDHVKWLIGAEFTGKVLIAQHIAADRMEADHRWFGARCIDGDNRAFGVTFVFAFGNARGEFFDRGTGKQITERDFDIGNLVDF